MALNDLTLSEIWIYPIKSLGGIQLKTAKILAKGLQYDRRWMLIDENGVFMTQRTHAIMALFKLRLEDGDIVVTFKEKLLRISCDLTIETSPIETKIWDDTILANEFSNEHSEWFSEQLGTRCKLVFFPEENARPVDQQYSVNNEHVSLADGFPFLIIGQSSLDDLNKRLTSPIPMNRLRPNFVFTGGLPYEEETWRNFKIGSNKFIGVKPCSRCIMTTINQDTAEKSAEPLKTLSTYRKHDNKIYFGQNVVAIDYGKVSVGEKIFLN